MFEDSTFESLGRIHTRSRGWMIATFTFNSSILLALILIPLIYPAALPRMASAILMEAPAPAEEPKPVVVREHAPAMQTEMRGNVLQAPSLIPEKPWIPGTREEPVPINVAALGDSGNSGGSPDGLFHGTGTRSVVVESRRPAAQVSSGVMVGHLVYQVKPRYPAICVAMHLSGAVVLEATISKSGTIENLRATNGPALLRQAALDAVKQWRYRPYLLNGQPVEVETTVNVEFSLQ